MSGTDDRSALAIEELGKARYVSLATFRRSGAEVRTPVWVAPAGDALYVFSEADAGKVKRIRATKRVAIAPCDVRGGLAADVEWHEGTGRIVEKEEREVWDRAYAALRRKYGWQMATADLFSRLSGRYDKRAMLELTLGAAS